MKTGGNAGVRHIGAIYACEVSTVAVACVFYPAIGEKTPAKPVREFSEWRLSIMRAKTIAVAVLVGVAVSGQGSVASADAEFPIAGTQPSQRPQGAPVINRVQRTPDWYRHALTGVSQPYPDSLQFLENQGNWYTPFNHPGMPGRYDIRGWHSQ